MLSGNPLKVSRCRCSFFDLGLLLAPDLAEFWGYLYDDGFRCRRLSNARFKKWKSYAGIAFRGVRLCRSQRGLERLVLHRPGLGVTDGIA